MTTAHHRAAALHGNALRLALLLGLGAALTVPAAAADDASTPPDMPKHEMGGNDAKPGFLDMGKHTSGTNEQTVPAPGKAAGASSPAAPPVPSAR